MLLKEREQRLERIELIIEKISTSSSRLKSKIHSFEILSEMCEYMKNGLEKDEKLDYDCLERFITNEFKRIVKNDR